MESSDSMYLDNLDEFVNDENKIVTYKWLSRTLSVHVNQSKQMLYSFVQLQRNEKENDRLNVTYLVAGLSKSDTKDVKHRVILTPENNLEAVKHSLSIVTSCHIYSVQNSHIKDSNALYQADYEIGKGQNASQFSAITCPAAVPRSTAPHTQSSNKQDAGIDQKLEIKSSTNVSNSSKSNASSKSSKTGGLKAMFAAGAQKVPEKNKKDSPSVVSDKKEENKSKKSQNTSKAGNVMSFFSNHATKSQDKKSSAVKQESPEKSKAVPEEQSQKAVSPVKGSRKKKANISSDEDENPVPQQKKRRRIRQMAVDSSSDEDEAGSGEEDMDVEVENPVPSPGVPSPPASPERPAPSPPRLATERREDSPDKPANGGVVQVKNGRRRRRKLVPKTSIDEDGFMVTERVWESESTDASEDESKEKNEKAQAKTDTIAKEKPAVEKKQVSPVKKSKQASLMSFFKKK